MVGKARRPATRADLEALPPTWRGEIIDGELYAFPRPAAIHSWMARARAELGGTRYVLSKAGFC
jgi:hypothetical protein